MPPRWRGARERPHCTASRHRGASVSSEIGHSDDVPPDGGSFELQLTLGEMDIEDAFRIVLHAGMSQLTVRDLLDEVFPEDESAQTEFLSALDVRTNPDLPEMYEELLDIFDEWRRGDCTLGFFAGGGPELRLEDRVVEHLNVGRMGDEAVAGDPALHLAIHQTYDVLGRFAEWGGAEGELLKWLQRHTLLYFMDKHRFRPPVAPLDGPDLGLLPIAQDLASRDLIAESEEDGTYELTEVGSALIERMIEEAESYSTRFDLFDDVLVDLDSEEVEFGTGDGVDLRVQVYGSEGVDPVRAVFLLRLYDATLDTYIETWREEVHRAEFFNEVLRPVLDNARVEDDLVGLVIESGYAHMEEMAEEAAERAFEDDARRRISSTP